MKPLPSILFFLPILLGYLTPGSNDSSPEVVGGCEALFEYQVNCNEVQFINASTGNMTNSWDFGDLNTSTEVNPIHKYDEYGVFEVCLTISDGLGCQDTTCVQVPVLDDTPPMITCPPDIMVDAMAGMNSAVVTFPDPVVIDNCGVEWSCTHESGDEFPCGITVVDCTAVDDAGNIDECTFLVTVVCDCTAPGPDTCCMAPVDVLFVMDNSGSMCSPATDFPTMVTIAQNAMQQVDSAYCDALFAVVHYAGLCGDEIYIEHDFTNSAAAMSITKQQPANFSGAGDDLNAALGTLIDALDGTPNPLITSGNFRNHRTGAALLIVIFTDAGAGPAPVGCISGGSALAPYTNSNTLKTPPYDAIFSVVHLAPGNAGVEPVCAAIASPGGTWPGPTAANGADPENGLLPRQYIPASLMTTTINLLPSLPPCDSLELEVCCDQVEAVSTLIPTDSCCYSVDLINQSGGSLVKFEAEVLGGDWIFNSGSLVGAGFNWYAPPTNNKLCVGHSSGMIPPGLSPGALQYCLVPTSLPPASTNPVIVYRWYTGMPGSQPRLVCSDTLVTTCGEGMEEPCLTINDVEIDCSPDNPYEYFVSFTVTNNGTMPATQVVLQNLDPGFGFSFCSGSALVPSVALTLNPSPLLPGATSNPLCVKIISPVPILQPKLVCFRAGLFSDLDCCHSPEKVCVELAPCCDPCDGRSVSSNQIDTGTESCCYALDIDNSCGYLYFSRLETELITPGVQFGYHAIGGPFAADWTVLPNSGYTSISWAYNNGLLPGGYYDDIIQFCFDDIDNASEVPQQVVLHWYAYVDGDEREICTDTLTFDCLGDFDCVVVTDQDLVCDLENERYLYTFTVQNFSTIPFSATDLLVTVDSPSDLILSPTGGIFTLTPPLGTGQSQSVSTYIESTGAFPSATSEIILRYRLAFFNGHSSDTCCFENVLDTLLLPPCGPDSCLVDQVRPHTGLTPNGDGFNDEWIVEGLGACQAVKLVVYNRWGNVVFEQDDYELGPNWNGLGADSEELPQGTYFYLLDFPDTGQQLTGFIDLRYD